MKSDYDRHLPLRARDHPGKTDMGVDQINGALPKTPSKLKRSFQIVPLSRAPAQMKHVDFNPCLPEGFNLRFHKRPDGRTFRGGINRRDNQCFHPNSSSMS